MTNGSVTGLEAVRPRAEEIGGDENNFDENDPFHFSRPLVMTPEEITSGIIASRHSVVDRPQDALK